MRVIGCVALGAVLVLSDACGNRQQQAAPPKTLQTLGAQIGLTFPEGSKLVELDEPPRFMDPIWVAKVTIPASELDAFCQVIRSKASEQDRDKVRGSSLRAKTAWWQPQDVLLMKMYWANPQTLVDVIVTKDGEEPVVYIECAVI